MRSSSRKLLSACFLLFSAALWFGAAQAYGLEIAIDISPNVLNIQSDGTVVTVHTDIDYSLVNASSVYLNGVAIKSWKVDNQGDFVAKFSMEEVKKFGGLVIGESNTMQVVGLTTNDEPFMGEQDIMVIDVLPQGR